MFGRTWLGTDTLHTPRVQRGGGTFHVDQSNGHSSAMTDVLCYRAIYENDAERSDGPRVTLSYAAHGMRHNLVRTLFLMSRFHLYL